MFISILNSSIMFISILSALKGRKKIYEQTLFEILTQTRLLNRLIGQIRLLKRSGQA